MKRNIVTILLSVSLLFSLAVCGEASNESISSNLFLKLLQSVRCELSNRSELRKL